MTSWIGLGWGAVWTAAKEQSNGTWLSEAGPFTLALNNGVVLQEKSVCLLCGSKNLHKQTYRTTSSKWL